MTAPQRRGRTIIGGGVLLAMAGLVTAQGARGPATLDDLVAEVRGLRAELGQAAGASMRMQLFVARLSLQEQRITSLNRQLSDVQRDLVDAVRAREGSASGMKHAERAPADLPADQREEYEVHIARMKSAYAQNLQREQQLRNQEIELQGFIAAEQARWQEFNSRLDELERSLPTTTPR